MSARRYKAHPQSATGDFYVVNSECVSCGASHAISPDLIGWVKDADAVSHCIWKRQPQTAKEVEDAIGVVLVSEVACHRYAGDDKEIMNRLGPDYCDAIEPCNLLKPAMKRNPVSPPAFALIAGHSLFERVIARLRSMASRLSRRGSIGTRNGSV